MAPGCLQYGNLEGLVLLPGPIERGKQVSLRHPSRVPLKEIWAMYVLLLQLQSIYLTLQILPTCFSVKYLRFPPPQYLSDSSEGDNSLWTCFHPIFGNIKKYLWVYIFPLILLFPEDLAIPRDSLKRLWSPSETTLWSSKSVLTDLGQEWQPLQQGCLARSLLG